MTLKESNPSIESCITDFCNIRSKISCEGNEIIREVIDSIILNIVKHATLIFIAMDFLQIEQYLRTARRIVDEAKERQVAFRETKD